MKSMTARSKLQTFTKELCFRRVVYIHFSVFIRSKQHKASFLIHISIKVIHELAWRVVGACCFILSEGMAMRMFFSFLNVSK